jgi:hypothetical protein
MVFGAIACFSGVFGAVLQRSVRRAVVAEPPGRRGALGMAVRLAAVQR